MKKVVPLLFASIAIAGLAFWLFRSRHVDHLPKPQLPVEYKRISVPSSPSEPTPQREGRAPVPPETPPSGTVAEPGEPTLGASISGRVVDTDTLCVPNARVILISELDKQKDELLHAESPGAAETDEEGRFELAGIPAGTYYFLVAARTETGSQMLWAINDPLSVAAGEQLTGVEVVIRGKEEGVIEGHARDVEGNGIPDVTVLSWIREEHRAGRTTTDADGHYGFERLSEGRFEITFQHDDYELAFLDDVPVGTRDADIVMARKPSISGVVRDAATREPIEDFAIAVALEYATIPFRHDVPYREPQSYHSESGEFLVKIEAAGTVALKASAAGYAPQEITDIDVESGQNVTGIDFHLPRGNVVRGTVIAAVDSSPIEGARIYLRDVPIGAQQQAREVAAVTGADGSFVLRDVAAGEQIIGAGHPDFLPASVMVRVREGRETHVTISLEIAGMIAGYVTENGLPSPGARIHLAGTDRYYGYHMQPVTTDENGYYEFTSLAPGRYEMEAYPSSSDEPGGLKAVEQAIVNVQQGRITEKDFDFISGYAAIEGYVVRNRVPVTSKDGKVFAATISERGQIAGESSLDESGFYRIEGLPGGSYVVTAFIPDTETDRLALRSVNVQVAEGRAVRADIDIGGSCVIRGKVSLPAGYEMAMVLVRDASQTEPISFEDTPLGVLAGQVVGVAQCDPDGRYEIGDLAAGSYNVTVVCPVQADAGPPTDVIQESQTVTVEEGDAVQLDFSL
jgi:hypothetical protein